MQMNLSEQELKQIIAGTAVGNAWPYKGGSEQDIEEHLKHTVAGPLPALEQLGCSTPTATRAALHHLYGVTVSGVLRHWCLPEVSR